MILTIIATVTAAYAGYKAHQFLSPDATNTVPAPQVYRHYKGGLYHVLHRNSALEREGPASDYVVYQSLHDDKIWLRPAAEFDGLVDHDGNAVPRFTQYFGAPPNTNNNH